MNNDFRERRYRHPRNIGAKASHIFGMFLVGIGFSLLFALVFGLLVMWLWNWLIPGIFGGGVGEIGYFEAFGLVILARLLFGGFGPHHPDRWRKDSRYSFEHPGPGHFFEGNEKPFKKWHQYRDFWQDEGKTAFDTYIERLEKEKEAGSGGEDDGGKQS